jgi:hypothetical protein
MVAIGTPGRILAYPRRIAWDVRPYREGDLPGMLRLFAEGGFAATSEAHFRWQVLSRASPAPMAWVAEQDGRILGTYCGTPLRLQLCGAQALGVHGSHAMTEPRLRRQGILTAVASAAQAAWAAAGFRLQIGVPWGSWGSRRQALGWRHVTDLVWVQRWLAPERALVRRLGLPRELPVPRVWDRVFDVRSVVSVVGRDPRSSPGIRVRVLAEPEAALDELWARAAPAWRHAVVRDAEWLGWRYLQAPGAAYRLLLAEQAGRPTGYLALKIESGQGWIADVLAASAADSRALVRASLARFRAAGVERVRALVAPRSPMHRALVAAGFAGQRGGQFAVVPLAADLALDEVTRADAWLVSGGDFDVV